MLPKISMFLSGMATPENAWSSKDFGHCNRIHIPLSGRAVYVGKSGETIMTTGKLYLFPESDFISFSEIEGEPYLHLFLDFYTTPLLSLDRPLVLELEEDEELNALAYTYQLTIPGERNASGYHIFYRADRSDSSIYDKNIFDRVCEALIYMVFKKAGDIFYSDERINAALNYISTHYAEDIDNDTLSAQLHIDSSHLIRIFKTTIGVTPHQYITEYRVNKAIQMLSFGEPVKSICYECGFKTENAFRIAFKKFKNVSPSKYK